MIVIATRLEPTMRPLGAMIMVHAIVAVPLVVSNVTNAWTIISNSLIAKRIVSTEKSNPNQSYEKPSTYLKNVILTTLINVLSSGKQTRVNSMKN